jgi:hypothetical protein
MGDWPRRTGLWLQIANCGHLMRAPHCPEANLALSSEMADQGWKLSLLQRVAGDRFVPMAVD